MDDRQRLGKLCGEISQRIKDAIQRGDDNVYAHIDQLTFNLLSICERLDIEPSPIAVTCRNKAIWWFAYCYPEDKKSFGRFAFADRVGSRRLVERTVGADTWMQVCARLEAWERWSQSFPVDGDSGDSDGDTPKKNTEKIDPADYAILSEVADVMQKENLSFRAAVLRETGGDKAEYERFKKLKNRNPTIWKSLSPDGDNGDK